MTLKTRRCYCSTAQKKQQPVPCSSGVTSVAYPCVGFTLIEMLVVIAIIALLAALLFPVLSRAREAARRAVCASNLRQIAIAILQYGEDYNEIFILGWYGIVSGQTGYVFYRWMDAIFPYVKNTQVYSCPNAPDQVFVPDPDPWSYVNTPSSPGSGGGYAVSNAYFAPSAPGEPPTDPPTNGLPFAAVEDWNTIMAWDGRKEWVHGDEGWFNMLDQPDRFNEEINPPGLQLRGLTAHVVAGRHVNGANFAYTDGHVKWLNLSTLLRPNSAGIYAPFTIQSDDY